MKTGTVSTEFEARATEALKALLERVSAIKLTELKSEPHPDGSFAAILARIDIFGHSHTLACAVVPNVEPSLLRAVLCELETGAAPLATDAAPVVIAPYLSPEAQALCKQNKTGFLDLEGNARLNIGEVFIGTRSLARDSASAIQSSSVLHAFSARSAPLSIVPSAMPTFSRKQGDVALTA